MAYEKPLLDSMSVRLSQDGNTVGTTSEVEIIDIELVTQLPGEKPFFVIKTQGWSVDSLSELQDSFDKIVDAVRKVGYIE